MQTRLDPQRRSGPSHSVPPACAFCNPQHVFLELHPLVWSRV